MSNPQAFFYRFEGLSLINGNKCAGFEFLVSTETLQVLQGIRVAPEAQARLVDEAKERISRAGLVPKRSLARAGILFWKSTLVPRIIHCDAAFGGSIAADPETYDRLASADAVSRIGKEVCYSPHNVDTAKTSLALMVLAQTWTEWAASHLHIHHIQEPA